MTYETEKQRFGREPASVMELDLDFCSRTYGVAPCTATLPGPVVTAFNFATGSQRGFVADVIGINTYGSFDGTKWNSVLISGAKRIQIRQSQAISKVHWVEFDYTASAGFNIGLTIYYPDSEGDESSEGIGGAVVAGTGTYRFTFTDAISMADVQDILGIHIFMTSLTADMTVTAVRVGVTNPLAQKCFNTRRTCQDPANYLAAAKSYRFSDKLMSRNAWEPVPDSDVARAMAALKTKVGSARRLIDNGNAVVFTLTPVAESATGVVLFTGTLANLSGPFSDYIIRCYAASDIDYPVGDIVPLGNGGWGASFNVGGSPCTKLARLIYKPAATEYIQLEAYPDRGLVRSFDVYEGEPEYASLHDRTYVYDQAVAIVAACLYNDQVFAEKLVQGIFKTQTPGTPAIGSGNGMWAFGAYMNAWEPTLSYIPGPDPYYRTGAIMWAIYALGLFVEKYPTSLYAASAKAALVKGLDAVCLNFYITTPGDYRINSFNGGKGKYTLPAYTFDPAYVHDFGGTEHNIDAYFALRVAGRIGAVSANGFNYSSMADLLGTKLVSLTTDATVRGYWNPSTNRAVQGIGPSSYDNDHALDCGSWYAIAAIANGDPAKAALALADVKTAYAVTDPTTFAKGFTPYLSSRGYTGAGSSYWVEGTCGYIAARVATGELDEAAYYLEQANRLYISDIDFGIGYPYVNVDDAPYELRSWPSVASTGWFIIAARADTFWDIDQSFDITSTVPAVPSTMIIPSITSVSTAPTRISPGKGLGVRAAVDITLRDHPHADTEVDPYLSERSYDSAVQGTCWGKLIARNPYYLGRVMRLRTGYIGDGYREWNFNTKAYVLDKIKGPDANGRVVVTAKDPLKLADNDRATCPRVSEGALLLDLDTIATSFSVQAGQGAAYPASGTVCVGNEIMTYTRSGDTFTVARGTDGSEIDEHKAGDTVQLSARFEEQSVTSILYTLLTEYAEVPTAYIDLAAWLEESDTWSAGTYSALIVKPTGVNELVTQLTEQALSYIWWDERTQLIPFRMIRPSTLDVVPEITDSSMLANKSSVTQDLSERISEVWVYYDPINPTENLDNESGYSRVYVQVDANASSAQQYGERKIRKIFARWMNADNAGQVAALAGRLLARYRDAITTISFELDAKDSAIWTGDTINMTTRLVQDEYGAAVTVEMQILEAREVQIGTRFSYVAATSFFNGRYGFIMEDTANDYGSATDAEIRKGCYICPDSGVFADGTEGYKII